MTISTLTAKGQTTIPKKVRDYLKLKTHDRLTYIPAGGKVILEALHGDIRDLKGIVAHSKKPLNFQRLRARMKRERALAHTKR